MSDSSANLEPGSPRCRVLVVDDSEIIRALLRRSLELYSFEVTEAADGWEALVLLQQDTDFAVLVIDLSMPRLDGIALIQRLRSDERFPHFPILVLTGEELNPGGPPPPGADALLIKPFRPSELIEVVRRLAAR